MDSFRPITALILLVSLILVACAPPYVGREQLPEEFPIDRQIGRLLDDTLFVSTQVAVKVVSVDNGDVLYDRNSALLFHPTSNMKLFTSAAALALLEEDYTFKTVLMADGIVQDTVLIGNIYLKGYGDPLLNSLDLATVAVQLASGGIKIVNGDIVGDVSYFDDLYWGKGWMWDDEPETTEMFITPLSVNHNTITVFVAPGERSNSPVTVRLQPETHYVEILNEGRTVTDTVAQKLKVTRFWRERSNIVHVTGEMLRWTSKKEYGLSVWKPELYTLVLLMEEMERQGIRVLGNVGIGETPDSAVPFLQIERPIDSVIVYLNKESDNLSAENILKTLGAEYRGVPGTAENGIYVVREFLASLGIDTTRFHVADGSGVSRYNFMSAETIIQLLLAMTWDQALFERFYTSLPIAGVDGTLEDRMNGSAAEGNAHAKTGTLNGVSNLSGYVTTRDGELLAFSILMQNFLGETRPYRDVQDRIVAILANYSRRVPVARR